MASWNKSTLSQLLIILVFGLIILIFSAGAVAIWTPAAYKLMSEDKTIVMLFGAAYLFILQGVWNAYIGARAPSVPVEKEDKSPVEAAAPVEDIHSVRDIQDVG